MIAGVSGGADSVALLDLLYCLSQEIPLEIAVACLDHGIREESQQEVKFVEALAKKYGMAFFSRRVELGKESKAGLEEKAREVRYAFLAEVAQKFHASKIAVAHHSDDQVETVLLHFFKGTGIPGLCGMPVDRALFPGSSLRLVRPLLCLDKSQILSYLREKGLGWCEDASNSDIRFTRNRIRHRILPFLEQEGYSQIKESILSLAQYARENTEYMSQQAECFFKENVQNPCFERPYLSRFFPLLEGKECAKTIPANALKKMPVAIIPYLLFKILQSLGVTVNLRGSHYQRIARLVNEPNGVAEMPQGIQAYKTPGSISFILPFAPNSHLPGIWTVPGKIACSDYAFLEARIRIAQGFDLAYHQKHSHPLSVAISLDGLALPLVVRFVHTEDSVQLLGAPGKKKVARILNDLKVPVAMRQRIILVTDSQNHPLWIPGIGISHSARIKSDTKEILELSMMEQKILC